MNESQYNVTGIGLTTCKKITELHLGNICVNSIISEGSKIFLPLQNKKNSKMKPIHVLLVEDNEGDIFLTTEALEDGKIVNKISIARDGKEAIQFLEEKLSSSNSELPDLILLDVNLPKKNGHEVLQFIKESPNFKRLPVIMLTTSSAESDIMLSYKNHANCFITKPVEVENFIKVVSGIEDFWISIVRLPMKN